MELSYVEPREGRAPIAINSFCNQVKLGAKILQIGDGQYMFNVTLRSFHATIFAAEKQKVLPILSVFL